MFLDGGLDWRPLWLSKKQVFALVDIVPLRRSLLVLNQELLLWLDTGKANHPGHLKRHYTARPPGSAKQLKLLTFFFFLVFCVIGNSNTSPAWSPRSFGLAAPGLTVGYSVVVQHVLETRMVRFTFPCARVNKVLSEWVWSLASLAMILWCYLHAWYSIVS